jgi:hypothetical protein
MIDERARDMDTDYNMRGYSALWAHTHHSGRPVLATHTYFLSCHFFSDLPCVCFCLPCSFSIYQTPLFRDLVFFNVVNVISSSLFISVSLPLSTSDDLSRSNFGLSSLTLLFYAYLMSGSLLLLLCTTLGLFICC